MQTYCFSRYFTVFGFNGVQQGQWLLRDLKLAQLVHLSPKATFTAQMTGATIGGIFNYIMMKTIVTNQFKILTSIEGSNIWSGQNVQQYNTLAIAWSMAGDMFSVGARYQWVTISYLIGFIVPVPFWLLYRYTKIEFFNYINLSIILWYMGKSILFALFANTNICRMAIRWRKLFDLELLRHRFLCSILPPEVQAIALRQIQLPSFRCVGWRNSSHRVHPQFCSLWRRWKGS